MKKLLISSVFCSAALLGSPAAAQNFTFDVVWEPVEIIGGMSGPSGPRGTGAVVEGTYTTVYADGTSTTGDMRCVGMQQPDGGMFAIHMSCSVNEAEGGGALVYGCNYLGEPGPETPLGCVGAVQGKTGQFAGRRGSLTMEWYSATNSRGTGQWYGN